MRHLISLTDLSAQDFKTILTIAQKLKAQRQADIHIDYLKNKTLIMLFEKTSTRTRLSFEAAMTELGGHAIFMDKRTTQFALTDFGHEIQAVMRFGDALMYRAHKAQDVIHASSYNKIPVIDACSEKYHPAQALSDLLTMVEYKHNLNRIKKITWLGVENNVSNTLMLMCAKLGIAVYIVAPEVDEDSRDEILYNQAQATGHIHRTLDLEEALRDTDFVHTDTWMNMEFFQDGKVKPDKRAEYERRKELFKPYQLNAELVNTYCPHAYIMHCMPCHLDYEITRDAVEHKNSIIFDQAENRLHIQKAILLWLLKLENNVLN